MKKSFREQGIAKLDRIELDDFQRLCSDEAFYASKEGQKKAIELQEKALKEIKPPSDGNYLGNWKAGEAVAQSGRGFTWTDSLKTVNGGGCYNCHQITKEEISYGTIGPSLLGYGKMRGNSQPIIEYTWNRINNSKAYNACSNMPRMAHFNLLTEQQMKDVMALLLDPASPVNQ
jgi:sulfur-oxidizing protein SoxX